MNTRRWLSTVAACLFAAANASDMPAAIAPLGTQCHATVDDAAIHALTIAMALPPTAEHGGAIYERKDGCFIASTPVTNGKAMSLAFKALTSTSLHLAGIYHTHTSAGSLPDAFSAEDVLQSRASKVPSFLGVHGFNHIRKLRDGFVDYGPALLLDRRSLHRTGVAGIVLASLAEPATPIARLAADAACYPSMQEAAVAALDVAMRLGGHIEYGGAILQRAADCFLFTEAVTIGETGKIGFRVARKKNVEWVAIYHTHPGGGRYADRFSPADMETVRSSGKSSYIGDQVSRSVHVLHPGFRYSPDVRAELAAGVGKELGMRGERVAQLKG